MHRPYLMGHMLTKGVLHTGFEEEGTSSGGNGLGESSTQEERGIEEDEGCSTCEELKAQLKCLAEKNNQLEGHLQMEKELHQKDMEDLQARHAKLKEEREKLVAELKRLKQKPREILPSTTTSNSATTSESPVLRGLAVIQGMQILKSS